MITRFVQLFILLGLIAPLQPALSNTREVVTEIASLIENNYFDAQTGREVARELRISLGERNGELLIRHSAES